jgi:hypothetical protein
MPDARHSVCARPYGHGKRKSGKTRHGNPIVRYLLFEAASHTANQNRTPRQIRKPGHPPRPQKDDHRPGPLIPAACQAVVGRCLVERRACKGARVDGARTCLNMGISQRSGVAGLATTDSCDRPPNRYGEGGHPKPGEGNPGPAGRSRCGRLRPRASRGRSRKDCPASLAIWSRRAPLV